MKKSQLVNIIREVINEVRDPESLRMAKDWADHGNVRFSEFINPESVNLYTGEDGAYRLEFTLSIPTQYDIEDIEDTFNFSSPAGVPGGSFSRGNLFIGDEEPEDGYYQAEVSITGGYDV